MKLYKALARVTNGMKIKKSFFEDELYNLEGLLPRGSGFDNGCKVDIDASDDQELVVKFSYHHMNNNGFYTYWTEHKLTIFASLANDYDMYISGRNVDGIKDYFYDQFRYCLDAEVA